LKCDPSCESAVAYTLRSQAPDMLQEWLVHVVWRAFAEVFQITVHMQQNVRKCAYSVTVMARFRSLVFNYLKRKKVYI
jgi:hypothetical protein